MLAKVKTKLEQASNEIEKTEIRARAINKSLKEVEVLPANETTLLLPGNLDLDAEDNSGESGTERMKHPSSEETLSLDLDK